MTDSLSVSSRMLLSLAMFLSSFRRYFSTYSGTEGLSRQNCPPPPPPKLVPRTSFGCQNWSGGILVVVADYLQFLFSGVTLSLSAGVASFPGSSGGESFNVAWERGYAGGSLQCYSSAASAVMCKVC